MSAQTEREALRLMMPAMSELAGTALPAAPASAEAASAPRLTEWLRMLDRRDALIAATEALLGEFDAFLSRATISTAFPHGPPRSPIPVEGELVESRFVDRYLYPWNFMGQPAVVLPAGVGACGLPIGVQFVARRAGRTRNCWPSRRRSAS